MRSSFDHVWITRRPHLRNGKLIQSLRSAKKDDLLEIVELLVNAKVGSNNYHAKRSKFKCLPFDDLVVVDGLVSNYRLALYTCIMKITISLNNAN
jgi:hypothetical protein